MENRWTVELNDLTFTIEAKLGTFIPILSVYVDREHVSNSMIWIMFGTLHRFDRYGQSFEIKAEGFGILGRLALYMNGQKLTDDYHTGRCYRCKKGFFMKVGIERGETVLPPPGTNWAPFDKRYVVYRCSNCGYKVRETATIWD